MPVILYATLGACAVLAALLVYRWDMYEREPWYMVLVAAALGAAAMWVAGVAEEWTYEQLEPALSANAVIAAVASTHEEIARLLVVAGLAVFVPRQFNDPMDGIIYGSLVGLGMAVQESIWYLDYWQVTGPMLPGTEPIRLCGHLVMGGITGFALGMARMSMKGWPWALAGCVAVSMGLHFAWDWIAFSAAEVREMAAWQTAAGIALMLFGILFYGMLVTKASAWSREVFGPEDRKTLWGWPFAGLRRKADGR